MNTDMQSKPVSPTSWVRRTIFYTALQLGVFLLGFVPMWLKARHYARSLSAAERQLNLARIHNALISALISVAQSDYESARQAASDFFTFLRIETDMGEDAAFSSAQREGIQLLFVQRDEIITLLAQSSPVAAGRLADLYGLYREALNR